MTLHTYGQTTVVDYRGQKFDLVTAVDDEGRMVLVLTRITEAEWDQVWTINDQADAELDEEV